MMSWHGNIFHITGPLWWESSSSLVFFCTKGQWRGALMFSLLIAEEAVEQTAKLLVIWDTMMFMWHHSNVKPVDFLQNTKTNKTLHSFPIKGDGKASCNTAVSPLPMDWRYCSLATKLLRYQSSNASSESTFVKAVLHITLGYIGSCYYGAQLYHYMYKYHDFSNQLQLDCLYNNLFRLTSKNTSVLCITSPVWRESTSIWWIPLTKGQ